MELALLRPDYRTVKATRAFTASSMIFKDLPLVVEFLYEKSNEDSINLRVPTDKHITEPYKIKLALRLLLNGYTKEWTERYYRGSALSDEFLSTVSDAIRKKLETDSDFRGLVMMVDRNLHALKLHGAPVEFGYAIYRWYSYLNHACKPNADIIYYKDGTAILYATKDIELNEEITIPYTRFPMFSNTMECTHFRRRHILKRNNFVCMCKECMSNPCIEDCNWEPLSIPLEIRILLTRMCKTDQIREFYHLATEVWTNYNRTLLTYGFHFLFLTYLSYRFFLFYINRKVYKQEYAESVSFLVLLNDILVHIKDNHYKKWVYYMILISIYYLYPDDKKGFLDVLSMYVKSIELKGLHWDKLVDMSLLGYTRSDLFSEASCFIPRNSHSNRK